MGFWRERWERWITDLLRRSQAEILPAQCADKSLGGEIPTPLNYICQSLPIFKNRAKIKNRSAHHKNGNWRFSENDDLKKFQTYQADYRNFFQRWHRAVSSCRQYFRKVRLIPYRIVLLFFLSFRYPQLFSCLCYISGPYFLRLPSGLLFPIVMYQKAGNCCSSLDLFHCASSAVSSTATDEILYRHCNTGTGRLQAVRYNSVLISANLISQGYISSVLSVPIWTSILAERNSIKHQKNVSDVL